MTEEKPNGSRIGAEPIDAEDVEAFNAFIRRTTGLKPDDPNVDWHALYAEWLAMWANTPRA